MTTLCPISNKKIDNHVARLNGALTILFLTVFIFTGNILLIIFLITDFGLRSGIHSKFSPLAYLSRNITKALSLKPSLINAGPKIFAARVGLAFNLAIILFYLIGLNNLYLVFIGVFGTCAFLESVFGICVACQFYPFVYKITYHSKIQKLEI